VTTPLIPRYANAELAAVGYLRGILDVYAVGVGTTLPGPNRDTDILSWANTGFVQVSGISDPINANVPVRTSVVSLDVYATVVGSKKPPWGQAFSIAETIIIASFDTATYDTQRPVTNLPTGFPDVRVCGFVPVTGPSRRSSDPANYARVGFDVSISWHPLG
jgi:hypothetical protein